MNEKSKNQIISKADIPLRFFIIRVLAVFVIFILILWKIPSEFILIYVIGVLLFILSSYKYIVAQIYNLKLKIKLLFILCFMTDILHHGTPQVVLWELRHKFIYLQNQLTLEDIQISKRK